MLPSVLGPIPTATSYRGAGHDACWVNRVAPTAMVMCPCIGGLSHNEAEEITREWSDGRC